MTPPTSESGEYPVTAIKDNRQRFLERAMSRQAYAGHALIEVLHTAQELFGHLTPELLREVALKLKLPPSRVLGVATFYNFFSLKPKAEHTAVVCLGTACYVAGAPQLFQALERRRCACAAAEEAKGAAGPARLSVQSARCIGSCGLAPAVVLDGRILPRVTPAQLEGALDKIGLTA
ncbi:MAG: NAD(P)H-dependent oxidoreductase subunit E [Proteobacteria bacterium]|nr:NAD(P)H-dependent oxidoreductase subunit E [Pseudomonadota bacterium]